MRQLLFALSVFLCVAATFGQERHGHRHDGYETQSHHRPAYMVDGNKVFYLGQPVKDASASSFETLRDGYAKDRWNVYFQGIKIDGAAANSFKVLRDGYAKDNWNHYYWGQKIKD